MWPQMALHRNGYTHLPTKPFKRYFQIHRSRIFGESSMLSSIQMRLWMWAIICMQVAPCQNFANCLFVAPWLIFLPAATFFLSFSTSFSSKLPRNSQMCEKWKVGEKWSLLTTVFEKGGRKRKSGFAALGKLEQISLGTVCAKSLNCWQSSWKYSNWLSELYIRSQRSKEPKHPKHVFKVHKNMNNYLAALAAPLLVWKIFQYFLFYFF